MLVNIAYFLCMARGKVYFAYRYFIGLGNVYCCGKVRLQPNAFVSFQYSQDCAKIAQ